MDRNASESNMAVERLLSNTMSIGSNFPVLKEDLRAKLKNNWKGIYRYVSSKDQENRGLVTLRVFNEALNYTNTFLSR